MPTSVLKQYPVRLIRLLQLLLIISLLAACNRQSDSQIASSTPTTATAEPATATEPAVAELLAVTVPTPAATPLEPTAIGGNASDNDRERASDDVPEQTAAGEAAAGPAAEEPQFQSIARVTAALVNVRAAPNLDAPVLTTAPGGMELAVVQPSGDGLWLQVCCIENVEDDLWVSSEYVDVVDVAIVAAAAATGSEAGTSSGSPAGTVTADLVNVRGGPGTNFPIVTQLNRDQSLTVLARTDGGDWLRICCVTTDPALETWMSAQFLRPPDDVLAWSDSSLPVESGPPAPEGIGGLAEVQPAGAVPAAAPGLPGDGGFGAPGGANPFTGLPLAGDKAGRRPVFVCINNDYAARPQFGISQADVMYEYLMEGFGITRFTGLFYGDDVAQIGPIRSARLINYYLGSLYNAGLVCSGASDQVRYTLKHESPFPYLDIDLDDPSNARYSASIGSDYRTRLRTSTDQVQRWLVDWGLQQPASVRGFTFGDLSGGGRPATQISVPYPSGTGSQSGYVYDGDGRYLRTLGGGAHLDGNSGAQVAVENVIIQYVSHEVTDIVEDSLGSLSIRLNLFGAGRAVVIRDGQAFDGTWRSDARGDLPRFYAADGNEIPLKPGRSWISVVPSDYSVSIQ